MATAVRLALVLVLATYLCPSAADTVVLWSVDFQATPADQIDFTSWRTSPVSVSSGMCSLSGILAVDWQVLDAGTERSIRSPAVSLAPARSHYVSSRRVIEEVRTSYTLAATDSSPCTIPEESERPSALSEYFEGNADSVDAHVSIAWSPGGETTMHTRQESIRRASSQYVTLDILEQSAPLGQFEHAYGVRSMRAEAEVVAPIDPIPSGLCKGDAELLYYANVTLGADTAFTAGRFDAGPIAMWTSVDSSDEVELQFASLPEHMELQMRFGPAAPRFNGEAEVYLKLDGKELARSSIADGSPISSYAHCWPAPGTGCANTEPVLTYSDGDIIAYPPSMLVTGKHEAPSATVRIGSLAHQGNADRGGIHTFSLCYVPRDTSIPLEVILGVLAGVSLIIGAIGCFIRARRPIVMASEYDSSVPHHLAPPSFKGRGEYDLVIADHRTGSTERIEAAETAELTRAFSPSSPPPVPPRSASRQRIGSAKRRKESRGGMAGGTAIARGVRGGSNGSLVDGSGGYDGRAAGSTKPGSTDVLPQGVAAVADRKASVSRGRGRGRGRRGGRGGRGKARRERGTLRDSQIPQTYEATPIGAYADPELFAAHSKAAASVNSIVAPHFDFASDGSDDDDDDEHRDYDNGDNSYLMGFREWNEGDDFVAILEDDDQPDDA